MNPTQAINHFANNWSDVVFHTNWQAGIVCLILLGLAIAGKRWPAPARHGILLIALMKFAIPPCIPIPGFFDWGVTFQPKAITYYAEYVTPEPAELFSSDRTFQIPPPTAAPSPAPSKENAAPDLSNRNANQNATPHLKSTAVPTWKVYAMTLHGIGVVAFFLYLSIQWIQLRRTRRDARRIHDGWIVQEFADIKHQIGLRRRVELLGSETILSPIAFGVFHPCVMLPHTMIRGLTSAELRTALAHELAHHARRDSWINALQLILTSVWWFNPLLWILNREIRKLREDCCDDYLLANNIALDSEYCQTLLRAAALTSPSFFGQITAGLSESGRTLRHRIRRIMDRSLRRYPRLTFVGFFVICLTAALLIPALYNSPKSRVQVNEGAAKEQILPTTLNEKYPFISIADLNKSQAGETLLGLGSFNLMDASADGNLIVTSGGFGIFVWNLQENQTTPILRLPIKDDRIECLALSSDGKYLAVGSDKGNLLVWETGAWRQVLAIKPYVFGVPALAFSPDAKTIAAVCSGGMIRIFNLGDGKLMQTLKCVTKNAVTSIVFSPNGKELLASIEYEPECLVYDVADGGMRKKYTGRIQNNSFARYSPDGRHLYLGADRFSFQEIDRQKDPTLQDFIEDANLFTGHKRELVCLAFSPDGKRLITGSMDGTAKIWDRESRREIASFGDYYPRVVDDPRRIDFSNCVRCARFLSNGDRILIGKQNGVIEIRDLSNNQVVLSLRGYTPSITEYKLFADGKRILLGCSDGTVKIQDSQTGEILQSYAGQYDYISALALTQDESKLASLDRVGNLILRDLTTGAILHTWGNEEGELGRKDWFGSIYFSPDDQYLVAGDTLVESEDLKYYMEIKWFDLVSGQLAKTWKRTIEPDEKIDNREVDRYGIFAFFSPDGTKALIPVLGKSQIWDVEKGQILSSVIIGDGYSHPQCFSPDGKSAVLAGARVEIWDLQTGQKTETLTATGKEIKYTERDRRYYFGVVDYSSDGKRLAAGDNMGKIDIWDTTSKKNILTIEYPGQTITFLHFTPGGERLVIGTLEGAIVRDITIDLK